MTQDAAHWREQDEIGGEHDEVAMGQIDEPHDAENEREPGREQSVKGAQQNALEDRVEYLVIAPLQCRNRLRGWRRAKAVKARRSASRVPPGSNRRGRRPPSPGRYPVRR